MYPSNKYEYTYILYMVISFFMSIPLSTTFLPVKFEHWILVMADMEHQQVVYYDSHVNDHEY